MKKMIFCKTIVGWILITLLCGACSHDYLRYDTESKDAIYFVLKKDSFEYKFNIYNLQDSMPGGPELHLLGFPRDYDREIDIELVDSLTTATKDLHYRLESKAVLKAGELETRVPLVFYRTKDPNLYDKKLVVAFRIKENEHFNLAPGMVPPVFRSMLVADKAERPVWWSDAYLGDFSEELYSAFMEYFDALETSRPAVYNTVVAYVGPHFTNSINSPKVWSVYEYPIVKYVIHPLYDHYQENPHPDVNIPTPKF